MATVVREPRSNYFALWFGFLGAPAAWSIQELATLAITSHVCYPMNEPLHAPVVSGMWWTDLAIVIGSLLVGLAALAVAIAEWRKHRPAGDVDWRGEFAEASGGRAARCVSCHNEPSRLARAAGARTPECVAHGPRARIAGSVGERR